eukprot:TRINITY_DN19014_c0_g2_i1.p1 TRINITY_DN19014_c0_g2~~TRINITY_DN19014_c0_g2_i1.p1  ORF type:complete len:128 (+),score=17.97 TRINITY_DN19014_c0_g2_i1:59-442(+)
MFSSRNVLWADIRKSYPILLQMLVAMLMLSMALPYYAKHQLLGVARKTLTPTGTTTMFPTGDHWKFCFEDVLHKTQTTTRTVYKTIFGDMVHRPDTHIPRYQCCCCLGLHHSLQRRLLTWLLVGLML